tara:strand:- start:555 stop:1007 length:453 start_codon:yes stop_codon:yes gene_type:complete
MAGQRTASPVLYEEAEAAPSAPNAAESHAGRLPAAISTSRHCFSAVQLSAPLVAWPAHVLAPATASLSAVVEKKRPGEASSRVTTMKSGEKAAIHGLRRPQRVRVLSESLPTRKPSRKSSDLQIETSIDILSKAGLKRVSSRTRPSLGFC